MPGALDVEHGSLKHSLETERGLGVAPVLGVGQQRCGRVYEFRELSTEVIEIHLTGFQHRDCRRIIQQGEQQMLHRDEFMPPGSRHAESLVKRVLELFAQHSANPRHRRWRVLLHTVVDVHCLWQIDSPVKLWFPQCPADIFHIRLYPAYGPPA